jgi:hypothetical protein
LRRLLILVTVHRDRQNRGLDRIGKGFNADGVVTGGWGSWVDVPDWFSGEDQGADVATARLEGRRPGSAVTGKALTNSDLSARRVGAQRWYRHGGSP